MRHVDRYFFAALPDPETAARIAELAARLRSRHGIMGKPIAPERLHITMHPVPFDLPPSIMAALRDAAEHTAMPPFTVMFDHVMSFGRGAGNRPLVLCEGDGDGTAGLHRLYEAVGNVMAKAGLHHIVIPKTFHPHVTLLYGDHDLPRQGVAPISWTIDKLTLVQSFQGLSKHRTVAAWALRGHRPVVTRPLNPRPEAEDRTENRKRDDD